MLTIGLVVLAGFLALMSITNTFYVPFIGNVQYFCSVAGTEYMYFAKSETATVHLDRAGMPVNCTPTGF